MAIDLDALIARTDPAAGASAALLEPWIKPGQRLLDTILHFRAPVTRTFAGVEVTFDTTYYGTHEGVGYVSDRHALLPGKMDAAAKKRSTQLEPHVLPATITPRYFLLPAHVREIQPDAAGGGPFAVLGITDAKAPRVYVRAYYLGAALAAVGTPARFFVTPAGKGKHVNPLGQVQVQGPRGLALVMPFRTKAG